ncbi:MAG TPA: prepilin-type N-terminal cleavage/methylation domain-containing protein [Campylobacterales bacterium]|nr:prepilin-type N-terminal cleavage/methylation domain-containing protein [Campylobacterales bacterium]
MSKSYTNSNRAFTLLEVLISIMLLSLVLMALYRSSDILRASNRNLFHHLEHSSNSMRGVETLYMDIIQADRNITLETKHKFHQIIINNSHHSLYGLNKVKIVWLVYKKKNSLLRLEGTNFNLPLKSEDKVAIDKIIDNIELFKIYRSKKVDKLLGIIKASNIDIQSFMIQNLTKPPPKKISFPITGGN